MSKTLKPHPLAERWPVMAAAEYEALKLSIQAIGQTDPIILLDGKILDGRHRYRACIELDIVPKLIEFKKSWGDPVEYVIAKSSHRNMSAAQRAWSAAQFHEDLQKVVKSDNAEGKSRQIAALRFGVSEGNVHYARQLMKESPDLFAELGAGKLNVNQAMTRHRAKAREVHLKRLRRNVVSSGQSLVEPSQLRLLHGDVCEMLDTVEEASVDVAFTDPPYDLGIDYHGDKSGDRRGDNNYWTWCSLWLPKLVRTLKPTGSIFVMLPPRHAWHVHRELLDLDCSFRNWIVWHETFGNHQEGNLSACWRPILYFTRSEQGFVYNTDLRVESERQRMGDKRANPDGKTLTNVWEISRVQGNNGERVPYDDAPPQLPIEIPSRCIRLAANPGGVVLDPFNGNGTTAVAALRAGMRYIGIDQSAKYLKQSRTWIESQLKEAARD